MMSVVLIALLDATGLHAQESSWTARWGLSLQTRYDDNPLRLNAWEKANLAARLPRFTGMDRADDVLGMIRLRGDFRGDGLGSRPARIGADVRLDGHAWNRQGLRFSVGASASQELTRRDEVGVFLAFTPSEFQRNYLVGTDETGAPAYVEGVGRRLRGGIEYTREILRGSRGGPELDANLSVLGTMRRFQDFPWRDRTELGARIGLDFQPVDALETEIAATLARTSHARLAEPVSRSDGVTMAATRRDYVQREVGAEAGLHLGAGRLLTVGYDRRHRSYLATLDEDPVYGDRRDNRDSYEAALRLDLGPLVRLTLGGSLEEQSTNRPGSGDTGDEADYERHTLFLRLELRR